MNDQNYRWHSHNVPSARRLRQEQTPTEAMLWEKLRDGRLLGLKFRRQHPVKSYVLDFYCRELQFAIEIDGGVHEDPGQQARDRERQQFLEGLGIRFARVATEDVESNRDAVVQRLRSTIQPLLPSTRPP